MEFVKTIIDKEDNIGIITAFRDKVLLARGSNGGFVNRLPGIEKIERPLYASYVSEHFTHTYGRKGLIFETKTLPSLVLAINSVDLEILYEFLVSAGKLPTAIAMHVIMRNFVFESVDKMNAKGEATNFKKRYLDIRREALKEGLKRWPEVGSMQDREPDLYTEVIFSGAISIEPKALFGYEESEVTEISKMVTKSPGFKSDPEWPEISKYKKAVDYFRAKSRRPKS